MRDAPGQAPDGLEPLGQQLPLVDTMPFGDVEQAGPQGDERAGLVEVADQIHHGMQRRPVTCHEVAVPVLETAGHLNGVQSLVHLSRMSEEPSNVRTAQVLTSWYAQHPRDLRVVFDQPSIGADHDLAHRVLIDTRRYKQGIGDCLRRPRVARSRARHLLEERMPSWRARAVIGSLWSHRLPLESCRLCRCMLLPRVTCCPGWSAAPREVRVIGRDNECAAHVDRGKGHQRGLGAPSGDVV